MSLLSWKPLLPLHPTTSFRAKSYNPHLHKTTPLNSTKNRTKTSKISAKIDDSPTPLSPQDQVNLSVLRFTFGISWLDESYLPRYLGYGFGFLILLNHFVGSSSSVTSAQLVSEALGLSLAAFSITLPYVGRFLKGATVEEQAPLPGQAQQIFLMSQNVPDSLKEDLAWTTYVLLRNTKSVSVLIYLQYMICIRGYWNFPENLSKDEIHNWFMGQIKKSGLSDVTDTLYYQQSTDAVLEEALPDRTGSVLIQPVVSASSSPAKGTDEVAGLVLVASNISYAYGDKDQSWIKAIANKFRGEIKA
ncbi:protein COFACTOR ASSEMBLY OF COMPLEX C SUBUNIT B CCB2, chloroplastic [Silene latifolia]|uniref:protein COFACTOR ASSEMBLY OF COMPLEX C SUBUNIT B CCB2, chloroplastic n=1 Tax=Silene latifolia TaxID=37657 RepID=UPI003D7707B5